MYCIHCGKELPENSKFCNHCGGAQTTTSNVQKTQTESVQKPHPVKSLPKEKDSKQNKGCSRVVYILAVIIGLAIAIGVFGNDESETKPKESQVSTTQATTEAPIEISAKNLIKAYQENEINASNNYKGKYLKVTGYVDDVGQSDNIFLSDSYYIYIDDGNDYNFNDIRCSLNDESIEKAASFKPGDKIVIIGRCEGFSITSVDMYDCTIIK